MASDASASSISKPAGLPRFLALVKDQHDSLLAVVFRLISAAMLFGMVVTLARILGPEQFGIYAVYFRTHASLGKHRARGAAEHARSRFGARQGRK